MRRREFITLFGAAAAGWQLAARAQQSERSRRLGVLMGYHADNQQVRGWLRVFDDALRKLGWTAERNVTFDYRWVGDDATLIQQGAAELVAAQPDLILSSGSPLTATLLKLTRTIPIVFANVLDPVGQGFVESLSRPGGNATGLVNLEPSMAGKWIELLKQVAPELTRVAVPTNVTSAPYADFYLKYLKSTASTLGVEVISGTVADMTEFGAFVEAQAREPNTGLLPMPSGFSSGHAPEIAMLATQYRLPGIYAVRSFVDAGGLMSYGNDIGDNYRQAATFVDKILRGKKPGELPVQFPTKFEMVINLKTAKALGLNVPLQLQAAADQVIE